MKILLVEDNLADRLLTQKAFSKSSIKSELHCVEDGHAALHYLTAQMGGSSPDVILSDMHLPDMTGHEILSELVQNEQLSNIPFVILSSSSSKQEINLSYELGASAHVLKPSSMCAFYALADAVLKAADKKPFALDPLFESREQVGAA